MNTDALEQAARAARDANVWAYIWGRSRPREPEPSEPEVRYMRAVDPDVILRLIAAVREADALRTALTGLLYFADLDRWTMPPDDMSLHSDGRGFAVRAARAALSPTEPAE